MTTQTGVETISSVEDEIIALERRYWQAMKDNDVETCIALTDFPCVITGPQGVSSVPRGLFEKMMRDGRYAVESYAMSDVQVRVLRDDLAVIGYRLLEEMIVDGQRTRLDAADASTWVRRDGQWRCAAHSEALIGDPFGEPH